MHSDQMEPCQFCGRLIDYGRICYQCAEVARTTEQPNLFETKEQAIARVESNANGEWLEAARTACLRVANAKPTFTSDDVWDVLEWQNATTHEPKAMGAVLAGLSKAGLIRKTGRYRPTRRAIAHGRDLAEWTINE